MRKLVIAALMLATWAWPTTARAQERPEIVAVDIKIASYLGRDPRSTNDGRYWLDPRGEQWLNVYRAFPTAWDSPVAFDPNSELGFERDILIVTVTFQQDAVADPETDAEFFVRLTASGSKGPPPAPPLEGSRGRYTSTPWRRVAGAPENDATVRVLLAIPEIQGVNQKRLRGEQDWDVFWIVEFRLATSEDPQEGDSDGFTFRLNATENPLLAPPNPRPFADAGPDQTVAVGGTVVLDGSRTFDSSNLGFDPREPNVFVKDELLYAWEWVSGPERVDPEPYEYDPSDKSKAQVTLDLAGEYVYRLVVDDQVNPLPSTDLTTIYVVTPSPDNVGPRARIVAPSGPVRVGQTITLKAGNNLDPDDDDDELTYRWRQTNAVGGPLEPDEIRAGFQPLSGLTTRTVSWKALKAGTYYFQLVVTDPHGLSDRGLTSVQVIEGGSASLSQRTSGAERSGTPDEGSGETPAEANSPAACGAGGLLPLALVPLALGLMRCRPR